MRLYISTSCFHLSSIVYSNSNISKLDHNWSQHISTKHIQWFSILWLEYSSLCSSEGVLLTLHAIFSSLAHCAESGPRHQTGSETPGRPALTGDQTRAELRQSLPSPGQWRSVTMRRYWHQGTSSWSPVHVGWSQQNMVKYFIPIILMMIL